MKDIWIRQASDEDEEAITALNVAAYDRTDEADIIKKLAADGDSLYSLVAHNDRDVIGHIQFFRILIDGKDCAAGLGPMSVLPDRQNSGIGTGLVRFGQRLMMGSGRGPVFVLGYPDFYSRFGFSAEAAAPYIAKWSGDAFMAAPMGTGPASGLLTYPAAFGV